ncbi:unnamed protein product [Pocillopora meandrina]|uniref:Uncharacterized protein n=1 Tax=Pocillopora meandrina TaxID=46732 RepID=A0AAU9XTX4_9CNID|nr:unnamed protein product [Pocillopora meandrina]
MPVNFQPVTPMTGTSPALVASAEALTRLTSGDEKLLSNKHQTSFSSFEDFSVGNETQRASPSLAVRPSAPIFSSSTISESVALVTSIYDVFSSHGQEHVGDFNRHSTSPMEIPKQRETKNKSNRCFFSMQFETGFREDQT